MDANELRAVLELKLIHGLGDVGLRKLLRRHATAAHALEAIRRDPRAAAQRVPADRIERAVGFIEASAITVLLDRTPGYPARLRNLKDAPPVLFCAGDVSLATAPSVAVVGSRRHTEYGATATEMIVAGITHADVVIVSGLARGIDRIAHETALCAGGPTVAVLGCGIDVAYPPEHLELQEAIGRSGLVLSEFVPGEPPIRHNFPKRNRILAALADVLIVVEAGPKSGALITVDHALDLGLDVFAVPGPIGRMTSSGTNGLIRDGACLLESPAPVLDAVFAARVPNGLPTPLPSTPTPYPTRHAPSPPATGVARGPRSRGDPSSTSVARGAVGSGVRIPGDEPPVPPGSANSWPAGDPAGAPPDPAADASGGNEVSSDPERAALLSVLGPMSMHIDDAARHANVSATDALVRLLELELEGVVRQLPGMRFARRAQAPGP